MPHLYRGSDGIEKAQLWLDDARVALYEEALEADFAANPDPKNRKPLKVSEIPAIQYFKDITSYIADRSKGTDIFATLQARRERFLRLKRQDVILEQVAALALTMIVLVEEPTLPPLPDAN